MRNALILLSVLLLASCGTMRFAASTEMRDSTRVEVRAEYVERIDTVYVDVPRQVEKLVTRDTSSHLENDFAVSDASIDSLGFLRHSLETKARSLPVPVKSTAERNDSIIYRDRAVTVERPYPVEKELTSWQKFRLASFWWLAATIGCGLLWMNRERLSSFLLKL